MPKVTTEQKLHAIFPWIGKQVRVMYDRNSAHTANCGGVPQFTDTVQGRLLGISARLGTYHNGGFVHDLVIQTEASGLVTVSTSKILTIHRAA